MARIPIISSTLAALLVFINASNANLIQNGDFETGDLSSWTVTGAGGVTLIDVWGNDGASQAFQKVNGSGALSQQVYLEAGIEYEVYWEQGLRNIGGDIAQSIPCSIIVRIDNDPYIHGWFHTAPLVSGFYTSQPEIKTFTVSSTGYHALNIQLGMPNREGLEMLIDNVGITPEPGVGLLVLFAIVCCMHGRRARN